jgi:hypothetical protein
VVRSLFRENPVFPLSFQNELYLDFNWLLPAAELLEQMPIPLYLLLAIELKRLTRAIHLILQNSLHIGDIDLFKATFTDQ